MSFTYILETNIDFCSEAPVRIIEIEAVGEVIDQDQGDASIQYFIGHTKGQYTIHQGCGSNKFGEFGFRTIKSPNFSKHLLILSLNLNLEDFH